MAMQLTNRNTFLFSTAGVPVATDVITTDNNVFVNPKSKSIEYKEIGNGALGNSKTIVNNDFVTADFTVDVNAKGSGAAGATPSYGEILKACGLTETITASTDVTYTPASSFVSGTALAYLDDYKREVTGIAGTFTFGGKVGEIPKFSFALKGFTTLAETLEANPSVTLDPNENLVIKSITAVTVGGSSIEMEDFMFDFGVDIQEVYGTGGHKEYYISDYKPTLKVSAIKTKGNSAHWTELNDNSQKSVVITLGTVAGNIIEFTAPFCQPTDVSESDENGKVKYDRTWACENSAGGDNFSIVFK